MKCYEITTDHDKYITTCKFNKLTSVSFTPRLKQTNSVRKTDFANFVKKTDFDDKLKQTKKNNKIKQIKQNMYLLKMN